MLTINSDVNIQLLDFAFKLGIDQFNDLISEFKDSLIEVFEDVLNKAGINISAVDSIELLGGSTRVPFVQKVILEFSEKEKLNRTLNADEAIVIGAGYIGASYSSSFIVKKVKIDPFCNVNVSIENGGKYIRIFNETDALKSRANYTIDIPSNVSLFSNDQLLGTYQFEGNQSNATIDILFNQFTIPIITYPYTLNLTHYAPDWSLTSEEFNESSAFLKKMSKVLQKRFQHSEKKNEFESLLYQISNQISDDNLFKRLSNVTERDEIAKVVLEQKNWFFENENLHIKTREFQDRVSKLKDSTRQIEFRRTELSKRAPAFEQLNRTLKQVFRALNETWPVKKPWITEEQLQGVRDVYNTTLVWLEENYQKQLNQSEAEDPVVRTWEIDWKRQTLDQRFSQTDRTPKPAPKPVPKPSDNETISNSTVGGNETLDLDDETDDDDDDDLNQTLGESGVQKEGPEAVVVNETNSQADDDYLPTKEDL